MDTKKSIILNLRWHRRIGLSLFFMVIFLAVTGFALNHSPGLKLNKSIITSDWLLSWYGLEQQPQVGFQLGDRWLYTAGDNNLFIDDKKIVPCNGPLLSAAQTPTFILALCTDNLLLLSADGELIEGFTASQGLPTQTQQVVALDSTIYLIGESGVNKLDVDSMALSPASMGNTALKTVTQTAIVTSTALPTAVLASAPTDDTKQGISLETVILDLHRGRFFGDAGVLFVDIVGLLLCILALTGLWAWMSHQKLRKQ